MKWTWLTASLALFLGLVIPAGALAAGGPVPPAQGTQIAVPGSPYHYAVLGAGRTTIVQQLPGSAGRPLSEIRVRGQYGIPDVTFGGITTGLSADGRTLVLATIPQTYPVRTTRLLVLNTPRLSVRASITLRGWSTVDAISPDGRWLYLLHYATPNIRTYEVLAYDLLAHALLTRPIVDPRDRREAMVGFPVTRVMSQGGRWAYTLYTRPSGIPFVHALDTVGRRAVCVDLPSLRNADIGTTSLSLTDRGAILNVDAGVRRALIDTRTFAVNGGIGRPTPAATRPATHRRLQTRGHSGIPWELVVLLIAALAVLAPTLTHLTKPRRHQVPAA
jgi:hypothetical protein